MIPEKFISNPIKFEPIFKEKIWGGRKLKTILSKDIPENADIGESWELSGYGSDLSTTSDKALGTITLQQLLDSAPEKILGYGTGSYFPLLFKFIDAHTELSVQVHPDDSAALKNGWGTNGKTECWYIVDAKPKGEIILGFKEGVSIEDVQSTINGNTFDTILNRIPISKGDVLFCPAGTVHAILDGTLLYEIQETSDTTFRFYDWGRVDKTGKPRQLHIEESLMVVDTTYHDQHKIPPLAVPNSSDIHHLFRVACKYFVLEEYFFINGTKMTLPQKTSFSVITVIRGSISLYGKNTDLRTVSKGETVLVPAVLCNKAITVEGEKSTRFLISTVPDLKTEVIDYLREREIKDEKIALLGGFSARNDIIPLL